MLEVRRAALRALRRERDPRAAARWPRSRRRWCRSTSTTATRSRRRPRCSAASTTSTRCAATGASRRGPPRRPSRRRRSTRCCDARPRGAAPARLGARGDPAAPVGLRPHRELFPRYTGAVFDAVSPAVVAADHTVSQLLDPERAARLVEQKALDPSLPGLDDVLDRLVAAAAQAATASAYEAEIARAVERVVAERLMGLAASARMPQVRALATRRARAARSDGGHGRGCARSAPRTRAAAAGHPALPRAAGGDRLAAARSPRSRPARRSASRRSTTCARSSRSAAGSVLN